MNSKHRILVPVFPAVSLIACLLLAGLAGLAGYASDTNIQSSRSQIKDQGTSPANTSSETERKDPAAIQWKVLTAAGRKSEGGGYAVHGSLSQTAIGRSAYGDFVVRHGFWQNFDSCTFQRPGDANGDGIVDGADADFLFDFICQDGPAPFPLANGDPNGDCVIDTQDIVYIRGGEIPVECTCQDPFIGSCGNPQFCDSSYSDPVFLVCPAGDALFHVYLRDEFGDPIVGERGVRIEFYNCTELTPCPGADESFPVIYPETYSDENGMLYFSIGAGGCDLPCSAIIRTSTCVIDTVPVKSFDTNGDRLVLWDDRNYTLCNDYNGNDRFDYHDEKIFEQHIGHECENSGPCGMIAHELTIDPEYGLGPNQEITVTLRLFNNSQGPCALGSVGFFATGFGIFGQDNIGSVALDTILGPGQSLEALTAYVIPDSGSGCISARYTTDCCSTFVEVDNCFDVRWLCRADTIVCYEFRIALDTVPILDTQWVRLLPPSGWTSWAIDIPSFPLYSPDTIAFSICTPDLYRLGDTASVDFIACFDEACTEFRTYHARAQITSQTGDCNGDCLVNIGDPVYLIEYIFKGGPPPVPFESGDVDCDGLVNIGDAVYLINYIFKGGPPPCVPESDEGEPW